GVVMEWPLKIQDKDQEKPVTGLYRIDETKFNALADETFLKVRKAGALPIAYAQLFSMGNIQNFAQLAKAQGQMKEKKQDIKPILGDDDMISFS
ncbi:MAG: SapC family protein, partial [Desulfotignum sp.]